jgi:hypothetical protein
MKIAEIAAALDLRLENGSPEINITGVKGIRRRPPATSRSSRPKYGSAANDARSHHRVEDFPSVPVAMLRSKNPYLTFARAISFSINRLVTPREFIRPRLFRGKDRKRGSSGTLCGGRKMS